MKFDGHEGEHFLKSWWRPGAGLLYLVICAFDFIIFPIMNGVAGSLHLIPYAPWTPLTLQAGGLVHIAFGSIVTMSAWTRTNEKIAGMNFFGNNGGGGGGGAVIAESQTDKVTPPKSSRAD